MLWICSSQTTELKQEHWSTLFQEVSVTFRLSLWHALGSLKHATGLDDNKPAPLHFTPDLKLISFTNPFLHRHSYSSRTAFMDLNLN